MSYKYCAMLYAVAALVGAPAYGQSITYLRCLPEKSQPAEGDIYWRISATPGVPSRVVARWRYGRWEEGVCGTYQSGSTCDVAPQAYTFSYWIVDGVKASVLERWVINRVTGNYVIYKWNVGSTVPVVELAGRCQADVEPNTQPPNF